MNFFRKLLEKSALVEREGKPFHELGSNLIHAVCEATSDVKSYCTPEKLADPIHEFLLRQEFLYFFLHRAKRVAYSQKFTPSERDDLGYILLGVLDASLGEISEACRSECREVAIHNANVAEMDYASSKEIYPTEDPETLGDSLHAKFARKIEKKLGREHNPEIAFQIILATSERFRETNIVNLLREIRPNLHQRAEITRSLPFQK